MTKPKTKKFYMNKAQQRLFELAPHSLTAIASRRFGKSEGIIMPILLRNIQSMPQSSGAIIGTTYKQLITNTLPATLHALERLGYRENIHFYIGKKAPKSAGFKEPYIMPRTSKSWEYYIHWYNGSVNPLISQDIPYSSNSKTLDYIIGDEAKTLNFSKLQSETIPANSGLPIFRDNPWHCGINWVSDLPTTKQGSWLLDPKDDNDEELIQLIEAYIFKIWEAKEYTVDSYSRRRKIKQLTKELNIFRAELNLFVMFNILDNLEIVGERYVNDQFRSLKPFTFRTALMNIMSKNSEGGFYAALDSGIHYYSSYDNSLLDNFRNNDESIDWRSAENFKFDCSVDTDLDNSTPLHIAFDTNINVNWIVVGQAYYNQNVLKVVNSIFVKEPRMLTELCNDFADYYTPFNNKNVIFYYDHTFLQGRSATNAETFADTIKRILTDRGWSVTPKYIGQAMYHDRKHKEIDNALKGFNNTALRFNKDNNEILLKGMEQTRTKTTARGWGKDKSGEKLPDDPLDPVEERTDGGDAFDTLFIGVNFHRVHVIHSKLHMVNSFGQ